MEYFIGAVIGFAIGLIGAFLWPKGGAWGAKQAASTSRRWDEFEDDFSEFSNEAKGEFAAIQRRAQDELERAKAAYRSGQKS